MADLKINDLPVAPGALDPATDVAITSASGGSAGYSYQRPWDEILTAALTSYTPGGNLSATTVQGAIDELDDEKVAKAGDMMTGLLVIDLGSGALPATPGAAVFELTQADGVAPMQLYEAFASQGTINFRRANGTRAVPTAVQDTNALGAIQARGYGSTGYAASTRSGLFFRATENWTDAAQGAQVTISVTPNGGTSVFTSWRFGDDGSIFADAATGGKQGNGTVNASNYFDDGVNIADLYVSNVSDTITGQTTWDSPSQTYPLLVFNNSAGAQGPGMAFRHISASPAASDVVSSMLFQGIDDAAGIKSACGFSAIVDNVTAAGYSGRYQFNTSQGASYASRMQVGAGVWVGPATGGDKGAGTLNATSYYANNQLFADTNGLLRLRQYTVATLPAAGTAGRRAAVTDASAPSYGATVTGGGAINIPVYDNGSNWVTV